MKRNSVYLLVALVLFSLPVQSIAMEHPTKVSFGYQGLMAGTYLNALSVRGG